MGSPRRRRTCASSWRRARRSRKPASRPRFVLARVSAGPSEPRLPLSVAHLRAIGMAGLLLSWRCASGLGGVSDGPARRKQSCARRRPAAIRVIQMSPKRWPCRRRSAGKSDRRSGRRRVTGSRRERSPRPGCRDDRICHGAIVRRRRAMLPVLGDCASHCRHSRVLAGAAGRDCELAPDGCGSSEVTGEWRVTPRGWCGCGSGIRGRGDVLGRGGIASRRRSHRWL